MFKQTVEGLELLHQGKVRDTFKVPDFPDLLFIVATDRVSTHNVVHESEIPQKGYVLTALTVFWMTSLSNRIKTHLVASGNEMKKFLPVDVWSDDLSKRGLVVKRLDMLPIEFIFRSRMAGSLYKDYYQKGIPNPYGLDLPQGLELMSSFPRTIFTPTDKSDTDDPVNASEIIDKYPLPYMLTLAAYLQGSLLARSRGIEIIDGKFEVGIDPLTRDFVLADECLTPDSCRFVAREGIVVGNEPAWLDKQFLREEAERVWAGGKKFPIRFSDKVVNETTRRYEEILKLLTQR